MASKDSEELKSNERYSLGDYSFRIERSSVPGSTNDKIEAICTDKDGHNARKSIQVPSSTQLDGWYVEANETEATVYVIEKIPTGDKKESDLDISPVPYPIPIGSQVVAIDKDKTTRMSTSAPVMSGIIRNDRADYVSASSQQGSKGIFKNEAIDGSRPPIILEIDLNSSYTYNGKTVWYAVGDTTPVSAFSSVEGPFQYISGSGSFKADKIAWVAVYGNSSGDDYETKQVMVGRFAIDIEDAGGDGPGSDWIDPGDYDPDWEEGDPTHTLYVTVTGALSGRHNDPIEDPSYSYIPADKDTVKDYGCGGDGGHGGGGGAGASTVVVHKFATNQSNSKEVTAIARRHGYGSGGGKGGKGGDGCILVYY